MVVLNELATIMTPSIMYAALWHVNYWLVHFVFISFFPWYQKLAPATHAFYVKKLKLAKRGMTTDSETSAVASYYRNFFVTSVLSSTHGVVMAVLLVPFIMNEPSFLWTATIESTSKDPAGNLEWYPAKS
jgi:hypothetical protein